MKRSLKYFIGILTGFLAITSCENQIEEPSPILVDNSILDKYISVGGSLTAGYTNGGLYREGQLTSYPNLVAQQAGVKFDQALFPIGQENGTGFWVTTQNNTSLQFDKISDKLAITSTAPLTLAKYAGTVGNNYGVAGLRVSDVNKAGFGNAKTQGFNPFFERILPAEKAETSYTDFVKESNATFFTASIGEQDLLSYATSGGKTSMTETSSFAINIQKLLDALVVNKAKGILTNIPNVLELPYFNFYTFQELSKNVGSTDIFITTGNGIVRAATANDKILMEAIPNVGKPNTANQKKGFSMAFPLANEEVLDKDEISIIASRLSDFNGVLKFEADKRGIILADLNGLYAQVKSKTYTVNGIKFDNSLFTGGFFSLDGINPTPRGSAVIANEIIKVINENYKNSLKTAIPSLDVSKFEALKVK
jgi:GDSL-like Lipase/Acylhydrolase